METTNTTNRMNATNKTNRNIKRGEVYWFDMNLVYAGERGSVQSNCRPVLIIQNDVGNLYSPTVIIVPMTSRTKKKMPTHSNVKHKELLKSDSTVLAEQIFTVPKDELGDYVCEVSQEELKNVQQALLVSVGLQN